MSNLYIVVHVHSTVTIDWQDICTCQSFCALFFFFSILQFYNFFFFFPFKSSKAIEVVGIFFSTVPTFVILFSNFNCTLWYFQIFCKFKLVHTHSFCYTMNGYSRDGTAMSNIQQFICSKVWLVCSYVLGCLILFCPSFFSYMSYFFMKLWDKF